MQIATSHKTFRHGKKFTDVQQKIDANYETSSYKQCGDESNLQVSTNMKAILYFGVSLQ